MCLGIPGRVVELCEVDGLRMGRVDFGGVRRLVCLEHVDAAVGEHVLVHVGFALTKLTSEEAEEIRALLSEVAADLEPELGPPPAFDEPAFDDEGGRPS